MVRCTGRRGVLLKTLACATWLAFLVSCGGGGSGSMGSATAGGNGVTASESARLLAEFVALDSNHQYVRVWDPAQPDVAIQNVRISVSNGIMWTASHLAFSDATQYDPAARTLTTLGHAKVFFDNDGKLYSIDLRGGQSHVPVQLSSAVDVFTTVKAYPMSADGADAWIDVQGGANDWAIRTSMAATDAPVALRGIKAALRDDVTGLPLFFFAALGSQSGTHYVPTTYEVVDGGLSKRGVAAVDGMAAGDVWLGADPGVAGLAYLEIAGQLRMLRWSAAGVSVDATSPYAFASGGTSVPAARSLYVSDGTALLELADGVVRSVGAFSVAPATLVDAGGYVAATQAVVQVGATLTLTRVETLRKSDGLLTAIEEATDGLQLLGATDDRLILAGTPEAGQAFVLASGDNQLRTSVGTQFVGLVRAAGGRIDQAAAPVGLLSCTAGATTGFCGAGALSQQVLASGTSTILGSLETSAAWMRGDAIAGVPGALAGQSFLPTTAGLASDETDARDAWQLTSGTAGSLRRATTNLP
jgi:hypothetical protein